MITNVLFLYHLLPGFLYGLCCRPPGGQQPPLLLLLHSIVVGQLEVGGGALAGQPAAPDGSSSVAGRAGGLGRADCRIENITLNRKLISGQS